MADITTIVTATVERDVPHAKSTLANINTAWEQLRQYSSTGIVTQLHQWEHLTQAIEDT